MIEIVEIDKAIENHEKSAPDWQKLCEEAEKAYADVMLRKGEEDIESIKQEKYELWQEAIEALNASGAASKSTTTITAEVRSLDEQWVAFMATQTKENFLYEYCCDLYHGQVGNCPTVNGAMIREKVLKFRKLVSIYRQDYDRFAQLEAKHRDIIAPGTQWPRLSGNTVFAYAPFTIKREKDWHS